MRIEATQKRVNNIHQLRALQQKRARKIGAGRQNQQPARTCLKPIYTIHSMWLRLACAQRQLGKIMHVRRRRRLFISCAIHAMQLFIVLRFSTPRSRREWRRQLQQHTPQHQFSTNSFLSDAQKKMCYLRPP